MLNNPPSKLQFKKMIKASVTNYWEIKLRGEASFLDSLQFFKPNFMSLGRPHPLWTTCRSDPYEVSKAVQQARFLSGGYRSESWPGTGVKIKVDIVSQRPVKVK